VFGVDLRLETRSVCTVSSFKVTICQSKKMNDIDAVATKNVIVEMAACDLEAGDEGGNLSKESC
jgi:hypothetical protein